MEYSIYILFLFILILGHLSDVELHYWYAKLVTKQINEQEASDPLTDGLCTHVYLHPVFSSTSGVSCVSWNSLADVLTMTLVLQILKVVEESQQENLSEAMSSHSRIINEAKSDNVAHNWALGVGN